MGGTGFRRLPSFPSLTEYAFHSNTPINRRSNVANALDTSADQHIGLKARRFFNQLQCVVWSTMHLDMCWLLSGQRRVPNLAHLRREVHHDRILRGWTKKFGKESDETQNHGGSRLPLENADVCMKVGGILEPILEPHTVRYSTRRCLGRCRFCTIFHTKWNLKTTTFSENLFFYE